MKGDVKREKFLFIGGYRNDRYDMEWNNDRDRWKSGNGNMGEDYRYNEGEVKEEMGNCGKMVMEYEKWEDFKWRYLEIRKM